MHISDWNRRVIELDLYLTNDPASSNVVYTPLSLNDDAGCRAQALSYLAMVHDLINAEPTFDENERLSKEEYDLIQTVRDRLYVLENNIVYDLFFSQKPDGLAFRAFRIAKRADDARPLAITLSSQEKVTWSLIRTWRMRLISAQAAYRSRLNTMFAARCFRMMDISTRDISDVNVGAMLQLSRTEFTDLITQNTQHCYAFVEFLNAMKEKIGAPEIFYYRNWRGSKSAGAYNWKSDIPSDMLEAANRAMSMLELDRLFNHVQRLVDQYTTMIQPTLGTQRRSDHAARVRKLAIQIVTESIALAKALCAIAVNRYLRAFYAPNDVEKVQTLAGRVDALLLQYGSTVTRPEMKEVRERLERLFGLHTVMIEDAPVYGAYDYDVLE